MTTSPFEREVYEQPDALSGTLGYVRAHRRRFEDLAAVYAAGGFRRVVFLGMGASLAASYPACGALNAQGILCQALEAADYLHFRLGSADAQALHILVSQSGRSAEVVGLLSALEGRGVCWGVSNNEDSPLAAGAERHFPICAGREESCTSKTYVSTLLLNYLLAASLAGRMTDGTLAEVETLVAAVRSVLDAYAGDGLDRAMGVLWEGGRDFFVMGRGPSFATALLGSILLKEVCRTNAEGIDTGAVRHGPMEIVGPAFRAIVCAPRGSCVDIDRGIVRDIVSFGGRAVVQTDADWPAEGAHVNRLPSVNRYLAPILEILLIEVLCCRIAERKGIRPAAFGHFTKVTTQE